MNSISAVVIAKNEEKRLKECLESVKFAKEIIVVDDGSEDKTVEVAKKYTKNIFHHKSKGYVEAARNFALSKATEEWILLLDADEVVPESLRKKLQDIAGDESISFVKIPRKNIIFGKWIQQNSGWWPDYQVRFFRRGTVTWPSQIHAQPVPEGDGVELPADESFALIHANYESISQFLEKLDRYTTEEAEEKGANTNWNDSLQVPADEFISRFYARNGYKDGMHGLMLSLLEAFYSEVLFAKRWEKGGFYEVDEKTFLDKIHKNFQELARQIEYWQITTQIKESKNPVKNLSLRLKRQRIRKKLTLHK